MPDSPSRGSLFAIFLTVFIDLLGFGMVLPLLAIYAKAFDVEASGLVIGLLVSSFSIMQFVFAPIWGRLSDRIGRRPVILIGLGGSVIFYAAFGVAASMQSLVGLFVSRIGAGISGATIATAQAYIADSTTKENRARGMALIGMAFGLGFTFGPLLAAAALWAEGDKVAESPWPGYVAAGLSAFAFVFALLRLPESRHAESRTTEKQLIDFASLRSALLIPTVGALLLTSFCGILAFSNFEGVLSLVMKNPADDGGFALELPAVLGYFALLGFVHAMGQGMVRSMVKRMSEASIAATGGVVSAVGFGLLAAAVSNGNLGMLVTGVVVVGFGYAFIPPSIQSLISRRSDPEKQGGILGVGQSLGGLGRILGHTLCFPLLGLDPNGPFYLGICLMLFALGLILVVGRRGGDFVTEAV